MFRNNRNDKDKNYKSFDSWVNDVKDAIDTIEKEDKKQAQARREENNRKTQDDRDFSKKIFEPRKKNTVFRKFYNNKDYKEIFPRPDTNNPSNPSKYQGDIDSQNHEGKVNSRGSISGSTLMGDEGYSSGSTGGVNPDLRRRLREKKEAEAKAKRDQRRQQTLLTERQRKIASQKASLKKKSDLRRAIIASEIIGPPKSKKFS